ncbi:conserved hypothetical protein [Ruegeria lacuscaerulensis ITI-1157]|nr:conserved hypothetical protein [Ruegeria lacuscaerulensis ITI-1157]SHJ36431.1 hypothetical protein SAMN05444404_1894 [Ruegeria lacuscaerulensis ITI-1157]
MPTPRETILAALHARLSALPATVLRGEVLAERVPAEGLLILRDGEPGEPEVTLSPLAYHYQHRAEIEAVVQGASRDAAFDTLYLPGPRVEIQGPQGIQASFDWQAAYESVAGQMCTIVLKNTVASY